MATGRTPISWTAAALCLFACATPPPARPTPAPEAKPSTEAPPAGPEATAAAEEVPAAPAEGAFAGCAARLDEGPTRELTVAGRKAQQTGARLRFVEPDADGKLVVGVLGPINEDSGLNVLALRRYLRFFAEQKAEAIVLTGDVGETPAGLTRLLEELAAAKVPVLAVAGNRECAEDFSQGVAGAQQRSDAIVNLNAVRSVELGGVTFVSLPGYHDPNYIPCETGCRYDARTLQDVVTAARSAATPVVLVSHGPPLGSTRESLDHAVNGRNVGDPEINRVLREGKIAFGFFSNIKEAGARATAPDLTTLIPQDTAAKGLMLNPGPADVSRWEMNDGVFANGFATVVTFSGGSASWKLYRAPQPTPEDRKAARALNRPASPRSNP